MPHPGSKWGRAEKIFTREIEFLKSNQVIVKVLHLRGNNLYEVESPEGNKYLTSMPPIFRNVLLVNKGDYLLVEGRGLKIKSRAQLQMVNKISTEQMQNLIKRGIWPERFQICSDTKRTTQKSDSDDDELPRNPNRPFLYDEDD